MDDKHFCYKKKFLKKMFFIMWSIVCFIIWFIYFFVLSHWNLLQKEASINDPSTTGNLLMISSASRWFYKIWIYRVWVIALGTIELHIGHRSQMNDGCDMFSMKFAIGTWVCFDEWNCLMDEMNYMHESHLTNEIGHKHNVNKYEWN
jgi:hypothetical protein